MRRRRDTAVRMRPGLTLLGCVLVLSCAGCDRSWRVAVLGDPSVGDGRAPLPAAFPRVLEAIGEQEPDLVFVTGDLVRGRTLFREDTQAQVRLAEGLLRGLRAPVHAVPGNHDVDGAGGRQLYEERFGKAPWSLVHRGWRFIGLDTEVPGLRGEIAGEQLRWLEERLSRAEQNRRTVIFLHRPVWPTDTREYGLHSLPRPELHRLLAAAGVAAVFSGHEHHFHREVRDGVLYVITGGAGSSLLEDGTHHFVVAEIRGDGLDARAVPVGEAAAGGNRETGG